MSNATATTVDATIVPHPGDLYDCQYHFRKPLTYVSARQRARLLIFRSRLRDAYPATYPAVRYAVEDTSQPPSSARDQSRATRKVGQVAFLSTDVVGSTRLWEQYAEAMCAALARHDELIETLVEQNGGQVARPRGEGESRFAVFSDATAALTAASAIQLALRREIWPLPDLLKVRIAILCDGKTSREHRSAMLRPCLTSSGCSSRPSWPAVVHARLSCSSTCGCVSNSLA